MASGFNISAAWAAVIVAIAVPGCGGLWFFASSQARTETTVQMLDTRTAKMEARLDSIADKLDVHDLRAGKVAEATNLSPAFAALPPEHPHPAPLIGAKAWP